VRTDLLDYELPERAIAQRPTERREDARLLEVRADEVIPRGLVEWPEIVPEGALVVLNDTRVRKARLFVRKRSGGVVELLFLEARQLSPESQLWTVLAQANRPLRAGMELVLSSGRFTVQERSVGPQFELLVHGVPDTDAFLEQHGQLPLPPYIRRGADAQDESRYQTVFAERLGSAAAPTAGLHLTPTLLDRLRARNVRLARTTLHVGAGTFLPVRTEDLDDHAMHSEWFSVSEELAAEIAAARLRGAPVIAVGTTVVRALESARDDDQPGHVLTRAGQTRLLIQPGYQFGVVDALLTNFHAPRSTLLALVSAFIGNRRREAAYGIALERGFRFLSYGDAMWLPARLGRGLAGDLDGNLRISRGCV
jgi:S-adenosylmethionine:tRNA ribosyltransferase-isomerase